MKRNRISEAERTEKALEMIEEVSADAQSLDPKRDWKQSQEAVCRVYELVHSIRCPKCRKNHPRWYMQIDATAHHDECRSGGCSRLCPVQAQEQCLHCLGQGFHDVEVSK